MTINKERFQRRAYELDLALPEVAKRSGVSLATLSRLLSGSNPSGSSLAKLAQTLSIKPEWLLDPAPPPDTNAKPSSSVQERLARISAKITACDAATINQDFLFEYLLKAIELRLNEIERTH